MKTRILTSTLLAACLLTFGIGAAAQHSHDHSQDPAQQDQTTQGQSQPGMMGGGMMGQMTTHHQQMSTLMNKVMKSMTAIQSEKDPAALKSKLAEHQALLDQMRSQMMQQGNMMQMMSGQMKQSCPGTGDTAKPPAK
jgi:hypothetical protein